MSGQGTFLLTDIVGSTDKWARHPDAMRRDLERHDALLRAALRASRGTEIKHTGDGLLVAFPQPESAYAAARAIQATLAQTPWEVPGGILAKLAVVTGDATERGGDYFGPAINLLARLCERAAGGQSLAIDGSAEAPDGLRSLGRHRLRKIEEPVWIHQIVRDGEPEFPSLHVLSDRPKPLPSPSGPLVGREDELAALLENWRGGPVTTLTGPGGIGKSRLALEAAHRTASEETAVVWVPVNETVDPNLDQAIWRALAPEVREPEALREAILARAGTGVWLVLDGVEHRLPEVADLAAALVRSAPAARLLLTSREPVGISEERVQPVGPLGLPQLDDPGAAVRLFLTRAERGAGFVPDASEIPLVEALVRRLDGIPLALEIAAGRLRSGTLEDLYDRLERILIEGGRGGPHRHRTLEATFDWSYGQLEPAEQLAFRWVGMFPRRFDRHAAAQMLEERLGHEEAAEALRGLVEKSLVTFDRRRKRPYRLLQPVRDYSALQRDRAGEASLAKVRHADMVLEVARTNRERLRGPEAAEATLALREWSADLLQGARVWSEMGQAEATAEVVRVLWRAWYRQGRVREALRQLEALWRTLPADDADPAVLDARRAFGWALYLSGRLSDAAAIAEEALATANRASRTEDAGQARNLLAGVRLGEGRTDEAISLYTQALEETGPAALPIVRARILVNLGSAYVQGGRYPEALPVLEESRASFAEIGDQWAAAWVMVTLGTARLWLGDHAEARRLFETSRDIRESLGDVRGIAYAQLGLATLEAVEGRPEAGFEVWRPAAQTARDIEDPWACDHALLVAARLLDAAKKTTLRDRLLRFLRRYGADHRFSRAGDDQAWFDARLADLPPDPATPLPADQSAMLTELLETLAAP